MTFNLSGYKNRLYLLTYIVVAVVLYLVAAVGINISAYHDLGENHYWPIVSTYAPLFLFQVIFLPVVLFLLFRPIKTYLKILVVLQKTGEKKYLWGALSWLFCAIALTCAAAYIEFSQKSIAIWEVSIDDSSVVEDVSYDKNRYFENNHYAFMQDHPNLNWKTDQNWPNIFYYLRSVGSYFDNNKTRFEYDDDLKNEYVNVIRQDQQTYYELLTLSNLRTGNLKESNIRTWYMYSFVVVLFVAFVSLALTGYYSSLHLGNYNVDINNFYLRRELVNLSFGICVWCLWLPVRAANNQFKGWLVGPGNVDLTGDVLIAVLVSIASIMLIIPWFGKYKENIMGAITIIGAGASILMAFVFPNAMGVVVEDPRFYLGFSLIVAVVCIYLWSILVNKGHSVSVVGRFLSASED